MLGTEGTDNQTGRGGIHSGNTAHTESRDNQLNGDPLRHCLTEGIDNQTDKGHTVGHCQLHIQRVQTTNQTWGHWGTVYCTYRGS